VTIILSLVTSHYSLQVSDRLLTENKGQGRYEPWDPASNKSVVVLSRDGLISMGYTGPAFISRIPVDGWIAEAITGEDLELRRPRERGFGMRLGGAGPTEPLAVHLATVVDRLNRAARIGKLDRTLSIDCVGLRWQSLRKPIWPVFARIAWDKDRGAYTRFGMSRRRGLWESGRHFLFRASGRSEQTAHAVLRNRLPNIDLLSKEQAATTLIDVLRSLPPHDPTVSKDCLVTTIQHTRPHVLVRYKPYEIGHALVQRATWNTVVPASFTPWIVAPGLIAAPQVISGGYTHHCGVFEFTIEGPPDPAGDFSIMSSQRRRRL
jgi:hypothetical protein